MALNTIYESLAPKSSWWVQPTREAFMAARDKELDRMAKLPKDDQLIQTVDTQAPRMKPVTRREGAE
jgi:hypothetical protein